MEVSGDSSVTILPRPVLGSIPINSGIATKDVIEYHDTETEDMAPIDTADIQDVVIESRDQAREDKIPPSNQRIVENATLEQPRSNIDVRQGEYIKLHERLNRLEDRVVDIETEIKRDSDSTSSGSDKEDMVETEEDDSGLSHPIHTIPEVRERNWEQFKNRFCEKECNYAIEVLVSGAELEDEMIQEQLRRAPPEQRARLESIISDLVENREPSSWVGDRWIQRIRIQSVPVLKILAKVVGESWEAKPRTFFQPFRALIYFHGKMKDEFNKLESKFGVTESSGSPLKNSTIRNHNTTEILEHDTFPNPGRDGIALGHRERQTSLNTPLSTIEVLPQGLELPGEVNTDTDVNSKEALEDMRCYINFIDEKLMPLYHKFDKPDDDRPTKIRFDDLWYLFRIGDLIYVPHSAKSASSRFSSIEQRIWRLYTLYPPKFTYKVTTLKYSKGRLQLPQTKNIDQRGRSRVACYYIDYDGESYGAITREFSIPYFEGERDIRELEVYPLRFAKDRDRILEELRFQGRDFRRYITERPLSYNGWTLISDPVGAEIKNIRGETIRYPEHIDSDVIVDFKEAFQTYPPWKPEFPSLSPNSFEVSIAVDQFPILWWSDLKRSEIVLTMREIVVEDDDIDTLERNKNLETDRYLTSRGGHQEFSEVDIVLLPKRLFVYALRERKFAHVDVRYLKPISEHREGFKGLKINNDHRRMIQALVHFHFKKKLVEKQGREIGTQDLIRGKGRGLVILLHGVPGVGKTATAEAVAQANKKPLFPITCGDLGFTPESVETSLNEIFRLAHLWDCVLLLDEADIFLSQRSKNDLQRNALVSVFLRIMEYYNGILFLTTNRPGTLDEAVKSRVHVSLYYPPLGETETEDIFRLNLHRLKEIEEQRSAASGEQALFIFEEEILVFAREHFRKHVDGTGRWNGRQIRNAFQIAASLAHYDGELNPGAQRQLRSSHFQTVDDATTKYDQFRAAVLGKLDAEIAHDREERYDEFEPLESTRSGSRRRSFFQSEKIPYHAHSNNPRMFHQNSSPLAQYGKPTPPHTLSSAVYNPQTPSSQGASSMNAPNYHFGQVQLPPEGGPYAPMTRNLNHSTQSQPYAEHVAQEQIPDVNPGSQNYIQAGNHSQQQAQHIGKFYGSSRPYHENFDPFATI